MKTEVFNTMLQNNFIIKRSLRNFILNNQKSITPSRQPIISAKKYFQVYYAKHVSVLSILKYCKAFYNINHYINDFQQSIKFHRTK